ncbi:MAG: hypothetical protein KA369_10835 [Spirochaetes bacterium]|nr:hypothetical protein [Spirochaetota bacterium]
MGNTVSYPSREDIQEDPDKSKQPRPRCVPLRDAGTEPAGGKARGLARLAGLGLPIPDGFVLIDAAPGHFPEGLEKALEELGDGAVAVRSSAMDEDSASASFAGQYHTILGVQGKKAAREAILSCLASAAQESVTAYRDHQANGGASQMAVVVQKMVDARASGVIFTADPVTGRRDILILDAVAGLGENLVGGTSHPDRYRLSKSGAVIQNRPAGPTEVLSQTEIDSIRSSALEAERGFGFPLDMEWAIDRSGALYWLQARPVTRLPADPGSWDILQSPNDHYTRGNLGECTPGAVTPLSASTIWRAFDLGMQVMQVRCGAMKAMSPHFEIMGFRLGQVLINLTRIARTATSVLGADPDRIAIAITGRPVPGLDPGIKKHFLFRLYHTLKYTAYGLSGKARHRSLEERVKKFFIEKHDDPLAQWSAIDARLDDLWDTFDDHLVTSFIPATVEPIVMEVLKRQGMTLAEATARLSAMLVDESDHDVESADIAQGIDRVTSALMGHSDLRSRFVDCETEKALQWLAGADSAEGGRLFQDYLARHGHRAYRELELRQPEWRADPLPLVRSLQAACRARLRKTADRQREGYTDNNQPPSYLLRRLVRIIQSGVRRRERTKSLLISIVAGFKDAYRHLGERLAVNGRLPDGDAVFFLFHDELGKFCRNEGSYANLAVERRAAWPAQMQVELPEACHGFPEPLSPEDKSEAPADGNGALQGTPVCRGRVRGRARVAHTPDEAASIQAGEILIASALDVAWTPYFPIIAGLATEVGSIVSHGAVVAREYGIPAVAGLPNATRIFKTGDYVVLDGDRGTLEPDADPESSHR